MHTTGYQYILFLFQIMVNKKHDNQNRKNCGILQKAFSLRSIKVCRFETIDGVKHVYCIKHAYKFFLREQVGFLGRSLTLASMFFLCINDIKLKFHCFRTLLLVLGVSTSEILGQGDNVAEAWSGGLRSLPT